VGSTVLPYPAGPSQWQHGVRNYVRTLSALQVATRRSRLWSLAALCPGMLCSSMLLWSRNSKLYALSATWVVMCLCWAALCRMASIAACTPAALCCAVLSCTAKCRCMPCCFAVHVLSHLKLQLLQVILQHQKQQQYKSKSE